jgi:hypothetical protein
VVLFLAAFRHPAMPFAQAATRPDLLQAPVLVSNDPFHLAAWGCVREIKLNEASCSIIGSTWQHGRGCTGERDCAPHRSLKEVVNLSRMATSPRLPGHIGDPCSSAFHKITDAPSLLAVSSQKLRESVAMLPDDSFAVDFDSAEGQEDAPFLPPALYSDEETKAERPLRSKPEQANKPKKKGKKPKASKNAGSVHDDCASGDLAEGASSKKKSSLSSGDSGNVAGSMKRLLREAKTQWVRMAVGSICLFGAAVCNLLSPALFGNILDALTRVIVYDRTEALAIAQRNCGWLICGCRFCPGNLDYATDSHARFLVLQLLPSLARFLALDGRTCSRTPVNRWLPTFVVGCFGRCWCRKSNSLILVERGSLSADYHQILSF